MMPILIRFESDNISVGHLAPGAKVDDYQMEQWRKAFANETIIDVREISSEQIPSDYTFRGAWRFCEVRGIRHCMPSAREIQRDRMRAHREKRFAETDVAGFRGVSEVRDTSAIGNMVQRLRDVTKHPGIEAAQTVEDLKKVWPSVLDEAVPALGGPRISGDVDYDTKALESWAQSLTDKISEQTRQIADLEARRAEMPVVDLSAIEAKLSALDEQIKSGAAMKDLQAIAQGVHNLSEDAKAMRERLKKAEDDAAYALNHAIVDARLTEDKLQ